jgi:hypothetical protein
MEFIFNSLAMPSFHSYPYKTVKDVITSHYLRHVEFFYTILHYDVLKFFISSLP